MDYIKIYCDFIKTRISRDLDEQVYYERHHIIPRSIYDDRQVQEKLNIFNIKGKWSKQNIVKLTGREHFFAHELLQTMDISRNQKIKMTYALNQLNSRGLGKTYESFKKEFSNIQREAMLGKPSRQKGNKWSKESRARAVASNFLKGKTYEEAFGKEKALELKNKRSQTLKNRVVTKEMIEKRRQTILNKSEEEKRVWYTKLSESKKGIKRTSEWIAKIKTIKNDRERNKNVDQTLFRFKNIDTGIEIEARRIDMRKDYKCNKVHELIDGRRKRFKGWIFLGKVDKKE